MPNSCSQISQTACKIAHKICNHTFAGLELRSLAFCFLSLLVYQFFSCLWACQKSVILYLHVYLNATKENNNLYLLNSLSEIKGKQTKCILVGRWQICRFHNLWALIRVGVQLRVDACLACFCAFLAFKTNNPPQFASYQPRKYARTVCQS